MTLEKSNKTKENYVTNNSIANNHAINNNNAGGNNLIPSVRDSWFDNIKGLLIILVVLGHFIEPLRSESQDITDLYFIIYSFHMPAFVFVSGYFSRRPIGLLRAVKGLLIPYIIMQIVQVLVFWFIIGEEAEIRLFVPRYTLWFLLSLFFYKVFHPYLIKVKYIGIISLLCALLIRVDTDAGSFLSFSRTIFFYPFFLLGYRFNKEKFLNIYKKQSIRVFSALFLLLYSFAIFRYFHIEKIHYQFLLGRSSFESLKINDYSGMFLTLLAFALALITMFSIAMLIPKKCPPLAFLGKRTMSIYLIHGIVQRYILEATDIYEGIDTMAEKVLLILGVIIMTYILALKPFDWMSKKISNLPVQKILR